MQAGLCRAGERGTVILCVVASIGRLSGIALVGRGLSGDDLFVGQLLDRALTNVVSDLLESLSHPITLLLATLIITAILNIVICGHTLVILLAPNMHRRLWLVIDQPRWRLR